MSAGCEICKSTYDTFSTFISCFGCCKNFHVRCVKIKATIGDVLRGSDTNGLQWFCTNCRKMSPSVLLTHLAKSVESAAKMKAVAAQMMEIVSNHCVGVSSLFDLFDAAASNTPVGSQHVSPTRRTRSSSCISVLQSSDPSDLESRSVNDVASVNLVVADNAQIQSDPPLHTVPNIAALAAPPSGASLNSNLSSLHKTHLTVVNRQTRKAVFISRLACTTSADNISEYIRECCNIPESELVCRKFHAPSHREIASFKIVPPPEFFEHILQQSFWPNGTFVREYKPRPGGNKNAPNVVVVPQPKNF